MEENNDILNLSEEEQIMDNTNEDDTANAEENNKQNENKEDNQPSQNVTSNLQETIADTTQGLLGMTNTQTAENEQPQTDGNENANESNTENTEALANTVTAMTSSLINQTEETENKPENNEDHENTNDETNNVEKKPDENEEKDKENQDEQENLEEQKNQDIEPENTEKEPAATEEEQNTNEEEQTPQDEKEHTDQPTSENPLEEIGKSIQNALLPTSTTIIEEEEEIDENEHNSNESIPVESQTDETAKEYVYDSEIFSIPEGSDVHQQLFANHVVNIQICQNQSDPTRCLFSATTDAKVLYNYCKYLKLSNASTFHFTSEIVDDVSVEFFSFCTGRDLVTLVNPTEEQIKSAINSFKQSYVIPCSFEDQEKLKTYESIEPIERYASNGMIEYVNEQIKQQKESLQLDQLEYEKPLTYSSFLKVSLDPFFGFLASNWSDECERILKPGREYTHEHERCSIFDPEFEPNHVLGINNIQEIELAPNKYVQCVFSSTEDEVFEKFLSLTKFGRSFSYHFSSSPTGRVNYLTLCNGEMLISLVNPTQSQMNIVFEKVKKLFAIPCGLNDKTQLFFYDYLNKIQKIADDKDVPLISEEVEEVQNSIYCKKYEYDITCSYKKFLNVAYRTFIGYLVRSQFLEPITQPTEFKSYNVHDFITLRKLDYGKKLTLNWPECKIYIMKQYKDLFKFNQSIYLYKYNRSSCIIPFYGEAINDERYLVFGIGSRGTLKEVSMNEFLDVSKCRKIMIQLVFTLAHLHMTNMKPCCISYDNVAIDWDYNAYLTDLDSTERVINCTPERLDITNLANVLHTLVTGDTSLSSNKPIPSLYEPISIIYELCKKPDTTACDLVSEILSNKVFTKDKKLIDELHNELPQKFEEIEIFNDYSINYFKFNCDEINDSFYNFIKIMKFGKNATFQFIQTDSGDDEPSRIFIFESNGICGTLKNVTPKVVNLILSKMKNCTLAPVSEEDIDALFEYYNFDLISKFYRDPQLSVYKTNAKQALNEMNEFDDKFIVEEVLALSYALAHPFKYKLNFDGSSKPPPQFPQVSLLREDFKLHNEMPSNELRLVEVFNDLTLTCLYSTEEDYTFNEFLNEFKDDKFVVVHFSKDDNKEEFVSFCTNKNLLLLPTSKDSNKDEINTQVNKVINQVKDVKIYCVGSEDRSRLFGFTNFDLIQSFANRTEMRDLLKKVEKSRDDLLPQNLTFDGQPMTYSSYFKHTRDTIVGYYVLVNPNFDKPVKTFTKRSENSIEIGESNSYEKVDEVKPQNQTFSEMYDNDEDMQKAYRLYTLAAERNDPAALFNLGLMYSTGQGVDKDKEKAVDYYTKAADLGNPKAQFNLGLMYYKGDTVEENKTEAARLYQLAADQGVAKAQSNLGLMYAKGDGVEQSYEKAIELYEKAVEQDDPDAQLNLGMMCELGQGIKRDKERAIDLYTKSAESGNAKAQFNLGVLYHNGEKGILKKDNNKAIKYYSMAVEQELAKAQFNLGVLYNKGDDDVPVNKKMAAHLFQLAADQGDSDAQLNLGAMYAKGEGVPAVDKSKTFELYKKSAKQGNPKAQFNLAVLYAKGEGTEKNFKKAAKYYQKASDQDIPQASFNSGVLYFRGAEGVPEDKEKAAEFFEKTINLNPKNSKALFNLAIMNMKGEGVPQDDQKALNYFERAAELDNRDALLNLGLMYVEGSGGVKKNKKKALSYYTRAAELGSDKAQLNLGLMYQNGEGCNVDKEKAREYFEMAAKQGNPQAQINLGLILIGGDADERDQAKQFLKDAADQGNTDAMYGLARRYQQDEEMDVAIEWFTKAVEADHPKAQLELGKIYLNGDGIDSELDKAEQLLNKALSNEQNDALLYLGDIYEKQGNGDKADEFYQRAADAGVEGASERLLKKQQEQQQQNQEEEQQNENDVQEQNEAAEQNEEEIKQQNETEAPESTEIKEQNQVEEAGQHQEEPQSTEIEVQNEEPKPEGIEVQNEEPKPTEIEVQNEEQKPAEIVVQNEEANEVTEQNEEPKPAENEEPNAEATEEPKPAEAEEPNQAEVPEPNANENEEQKPVEQNEKEISEPAPANDEEQEQPIENEKPKPEERSIQMPEKEEEEPQEAKQQTAEDEDNKIDEEEEEAEAAVLAMTTSEDAGKPKPLSNNEQTVTEKSAPNAKDSETACLLSAPKEDEEEEEEAEAAVLAMTTSEDAEKSKPLSSADQTATEKSAPNSKDSETACLISAPKEDDEEESGPMNELINSLEERIKKLSSDEEPKDFKAALDDVKNRFIYSALNDCLSTYQKANKLLQNSEDQIESILNETEKPTQSNLPSLKKNQKVTFVLDQPQAQEQSSNDDEELIKLRSTVQSLESQINQIDQQIQNSKKLVSRIQQLQQQKANKSKNSVSPSSSSPKELPPLIREPDTPLNPSLKSSSTTTSAKSKPASSSTSTSAAPKAAAASAQPPRVQSPRSLHNKIKNLQKRAKEGDPNAQYALAACYSIGEGVEKDKKKGFEFYLMAATQGLPNAQFAVASGYSYGRGTKVDKSKAFEFYLKAAEQGHDKSQYAVGHFYDYGLGGQIQDHEKAVYWYKLAAEQGHEAAIDELKGGSGEGATVLLVDNK